MACYIITQKKSVVKALTAVCLSRRKITAGGTLPGAGFDFPATQNKLTDYQICDDALHNLIFGRTSTPCIR